LGRKCHSKIEGGMKRSDHCVNIGFDYLLEFKNNRERK